MVVYNEINILGSSISLNKKLKISVMLRNRASIYLLKVNNRNTMCEICSKLTIKTPEWRHALFQCFIVNFEHVIAGWEGSHFCTKRKLKFLSIFLTGYLMLGSSFIWFCRSRSTYHRFFIAIPFRRYHTFSHHSPR